MTKSPVVSRIQEVGIDEDTASGVTEAPADAFGEGVDADEAQAIRCHDEGRSAGIAGADHAFPIIAEAVGRGGSIEVVEEDFVEAAVFVIGFEGVDEVPTDAAVGEGGGAGVAVAAEAGAPETGEGDFHGLGGGEDGTGVIQRERKRAGEI